LEREEEFVRQEGVGRGRKGAQKSSHRLKVKKEKKMQKKDPKDPRVEKEHKMMSRGGRGGEDGLV